LIIIGRLIVKEIINGYLFYAVVSLFCLWVCTPTSVRLYFSLTLLLLCCIERREQKNQAVTVQRTKQGTNTCWSVGGC